MLVASDHRKIGMEVFDLDNKFISSGNMNSLKVTSIYDAILYHNKTLDSKISSTPFQ